MSIARAAGAGAGPIIPFGGNLPPARVIREQLESARHTLDVARARSNGASSEAIERLQDRVELLTTELHWASVFDALRGVGGDRRKPHAFRPPHPGHTG